MMEPRRKTPQSRPATLERRKAIIDQSLAIFGKKGFNNGTLADIAEQVDITQAGVLHHFGSKDKLLLEVLSHRDETDLDDVARHELPLGLGMFQHLIRTAFANAERAGIVQAYAVLSAESVTEDHPARDYFETRYRQLRSEVTEAFAVVCAERGLDAGDQRVRDAAASILAVMDGLQVQWLLERDHVDLGRATQFAIEALVSAVLNPLPSPFPDINTTT